MAECDELNMGRAFDHISTAIVNDFRHILWT